MLLQITITNPSCPAHEDSKIALSRRSRLSARQPSVDHWLEAAELFRVLVMGLFCIVMVLLALAGDVELNPGPELSESAVLVDHTHMLHIFQVTSPDYNSSIVSSTMIVAFIITRYLS